MAEQERFKVHAEQARLFKRNDRVEWMLQVDENGKGWAGDVLEDQKKGENVFVHLDGKNYGPFAGEWLSAKDLRLLSKP